MRSYLCIILFCCFSSGIAQNKNHFNCAFGLGPLYIFNDSFLDRLVGSSGFLGLNYQIQNKNQHLFFLPSLGVQKQRYRSKASETAIVEVDQDMFDCQLEVMMKLSRLAHLRVGLFFQQMLFSSVNVVEKKGYGQNYYSYGNSELEKNYEENPFQTGFCIGLSIPFNLFKHVQKFNLYYKQIASSVVKSDYNLIGFYGEDVQILSVRSRPSILSFGFEISLQKNKKKREDD